ncbi:MAG: hypothetical protein QGH99_04910 [Pseudomonadales bacterium]|jgi:hypothetical protein|nr:hypothetical protein [Gammaproteobacteria bacterium]MDP6025676.1 hypothetical protein [Pseudomonadales bacterium]MDP6316713.1 hypothetical protein [Pseudomonadales bacterium]MDP7313473.1 hypothetical protein [Pseudomonadales bacterium]MDP7576285.1 hypothetical protein [Pseudomonadales bacterium]|tara:strand:+ start:216 stop:692 length:477 start_codon:yes stop_codon:yes gene_type:complete
MSDSVPVEYMQRTRAFYNAQGFSKSYQWASNDRIPFHVLSKPLGECSVTFVTTAVPDGSIPKLSRSAQSIPMSDIPEVFRTDELSWDKEATHTRDTGSFIPLQSLEELVKNKLIGHLAERFHFVPTEYSQNNTLTKDAPQIVTACHEDEVDIAILVPL